MTAVCPEVRTPARHFIAEIVTVGYARAIVSEWAPTPANRCVRLRPGARPRHRFSARSLRVAPLRREFYPPLRDSSLPVSDAVPRLSPGISHLT